MRSSPIVSLFAAAAMLIAAAYPGLAQQPLPDYDVLVDVEIRGSAVSIPADIAEGFGGAAGPRRHGFSI